MKHVEARLQAYLDGELSAPEMQRVRAHCDECERCARALETLGAVYRVLDDDRPADAGASLWPEIQARLRRERTAAAAMRRPAFVLGAAAAVLIGIVGGILLGSRSSSGDSSWSQSVAFAGGSLLSDEAGTTLDEVYLAAPYGEEGVSP